MAYGFAAAQGPVLGKIGESAKQISALPGSSEIKVNKYGEVYVEGLPVIDDRQFAVVYLFKEDKCIAYGITGGEAEMYYFVSKCLLMFESYGFETLSAYDILFQGNVFRLSQINGSQYVIYVFQYDYYNESIGGTESNIKKQPKQPNSSIKKL